MVDTTALDLQALTAASLSVTASGDVTDSGTLAITGATTIDAGTADITLDEAASTFGALALTGANVAVTENAAMELAASTITVQQVLTARTMRLPTAEPWRSLGQPRLMQAPRTLPWTKPLRPLEHWR